MPSYFNNALKMHNMQSKWIVQFMQNIIDKVQTRKNLLLQCQDGNIVISMNKYSRYTSNISIILKGLYECIYIPHC